MSSILFSRLYIDVFQSEQENLRRSVFLPSGSSSDCEEDYENVSVDLDTIHSELINIIG